METIQNVENELDNVKAIEDNQDSFINGGFGLAKTYWLFGVIGHYILMVLSNIILMQGIGMKFIVILGLGYSIPVWIAIWNSATKYKGLKLWSILAKIVVLLSVLLNLELLLK